MSYQPFGSVPAAPADPIIGLTEQFRADSNPAKINLSIGVFQDDTGVNPVLKTVKQAERMWHEVEGTKDYLGMAGEAKYGSMVQSLLFGGEHPILSQKRAVTLHSPGGTGALRVGADFIHAHLPGAKVWLSDPTWPNHNGIFVNAGLKIDKYAYYNAETHGLRFEALLESLEGIPEGDVVLLHGCCHNPTGVDPTPAQWDQIVALFERRAIIPFVDFAYQGFGVGLDEDAYAVRAFASKPVSLMVSSSFSKNLGLYRERAGSLTFIGSNQDEAERVLGQAKLCVRTNYSNPPAHGGKIVETVLSTPDLRKQWVEEVAEMRGRIQKMRKLFVETLKAKGVARDFDFLMNQKGMFSFSGINKAEVLRLRSEYGIYLTDTGRINVAAMTTANMDRLCTAIAKVLAD